MIRNTFIIYYHFNLILFQLLLFFDEYFENNTFFYNCNFFNYAIKKKKIFFQQINNKYNLQHLIYITIFKINIF